MTGTAKLVKGQSLVRGRFFVMRLLLCFSVLGVGEAAAFSVEVEEAPYHAEGEGGEVCHGLCQRPAVLPFALAYAVPRPLGHVFLR